MSYEKGKRGYSVIDINMEEREDYGEDSDE